jgi:hypothetical protein
MPLQTQPHWAHVLIMVIKHGSYVFVLYALPNSWHVGVCIH